MNPPLIAAYLLAFLSVAGFTWCMMEISRRRRALVLLAEQGMLDYDKVRAHSLLGSLRPLFTFIVKLNKRVPPLWKWMHESAPAAASSLAKSGDPGNLSGEEFLALKQVAPFFTFVLLLGVLGSEYFVLSVIFAIFSFFLPDMWLNDLVRTRQHNMTRALPTALDTLALVVGAGLDFNRALDVYLETAKSGPLPDEFRQVRNEMRLGRPRSEAIRSMAARVDCPPISNFAAEVAQSEQTGTSLTEFLKIQSSELRTQRFQKAEELGQKAPVKMLLPLLLLIFPNVFIVLFVPMAIQFFKNQ